MTEFCLPPKLHDQLGEVRSMFEKTRFTHLAIKWYFSAFDAAEALRESDPKYAFHLPCSSFP